MTRQFRIRPDDRCWVLERGTIRSAKTKNPGTLMWKPFGYYPTLERAALTMLELVMRDQSPAAPEVAELIKATRAAMLIVARVVRDTATLTDTITSESHLSVSPPVQ